MSGARAPAPLTALFFLDRGGGDVGRVRFEPVGDAPLLLAATFNFALDSRRRMRGLLDVCALAARQRVERVAIPAAADAGEVAEAIRERVRTGP